MADQIKAPVNLPDPMVMIRDECWVDARHISVITSNRVYVIGVDGGFTIDSDICTLTALKDKVSQIRSTYANARANNGGMSTD